MKGDGKGGDLFKSFFRQTNNPKMQELFERQINQDLQKTLAAPQEEPSVKHLKPSLSSKASKKKQELLAAEAESLRLFEADFQKTVDLKVEDYERLLKAGSMSLAPMALSNVSDSPDDLRDSAILFEAIKALGQAKVLQQEV